MPSGAGRPAGYPERLRGVPLDSPSSRSRRRRATPTAATVPEAASTARSTARFGNDCDAAAGRYCAVGSDVRHTATRGTNAGPNSSSVGVTAHAGTPPSTTNSATLNAKSRRFMSPSPLCSLPCESLSLCARGCALKWASPGDRGWIKVTNPNYWRRAKARSCKRCSPPWNGQPNPRAYSPSEPPRQDGSMCSLDSQSWRTRPS